MQVMDSDTELRGWRSPCGSPRARVAVLTLRVGTPGSDSGLEPGSDGPLPAPFPELPFVPIGKRHEK